MNLPSVQWRGVPDASREAARQAREDTRLHGHVLTLARAGWLALAALVVGLFVVAIPVELRAVGTVCAARTCTGLYLTQEQGRTLAQIGLSPGAFAAYLTALDLAVAAGFGVVAALLFWRKSDERMALLSALTLLTFGTTTFSNSLGNLAVLHHFWMWPVAALGFTGALCLTLFLYLFPDGRFVPSWSRWVLVPWVLAQGAHFFLRGSPADYSLWPLPLGIATFLAGLGPALAVVIYRYRHVSTTAEREQTRWVVLGVTAALATYLGTVIAYDGIAPPAARLNPLLTAGVLTLVDCAMLLIPLTIGIAILRYRLWDIDLLISRTLLYLALTACVVAVYVLVVGALGALFAARGTLLVSLIATGLVAVLFQPLRERLQRAVTRLLYGERDDPYRVLSRLGRRLEHTLAPEAVLPVVADTALHALKLPSVAIKVHLDEGSYLGASAALGSVPPTAADPLSVPLVYQGESVGELLLGRRRGGEPFGPADYRLLDDLARQAGVAVHAVRLHTQAVRLAADLQHAREHLVNAREEERRRLRRDLHDGLGPQLGSQTLMLAAARKLLHHDPPAADALLADVSTSIRAAMSDVRRLVYDLRPPALDDLGLVAALREHALQLEPGGRSSAPSDSLPSLDVARAAGERAVHITIETPEPLPPLPAAVEVAVYRITLEALNNVVRHAEAHSCTVRLAIAGDLCLEVEDDGRGLPADRHAGIGLTSMQERARELGGQCTISTKSLPDHGTLVRASLPLPRETP